MAWDKTKPEGSDDRKDGALAIRTWKADIQTALTTEGVFPGPAPSAPVFIWTPKSGNTAARPAAGNAGRWYWNSETKTIQRDNGLTWDDLTTPPDLIPAGKKMIFYNTSAPTGWTQDGAHNDSTLRIVVGSGGGNGGLDSIASPPSHNHGSLTDNPTTDLSHTHSFGGATDSVPKNPGVDMHAFLYSTQTDLTSSGDIDHVHDITPDNIVAWSPKYIDVIICYRS